MPDPCSSDSRVLDLWEFVYDVFWSRLCLILLYQV